MANEPRDEHEEIPDEVAPDSEDEDRSAILKRRAIFIASAIAGLTLASCDGEPQPCLDVATTTGSGGTGGEPQPCLDMQPTGGTGGEPQPCLGMTMGGAGGTAGAGGAGGAGGRPQPCLQMPATGGAGGTTGSGGTGGM